MTHGDPPNIFQKAAAERLRVVLARRERLLEAWIAQYGYPPGEVQLVERPDEAVVFRIERRPDLPAPSDELCDLRERHQKLRAALERMADEATAHLWAAPNLSNGELADALRTLLDDTR